MNKQRHFKYAGPLLGDDNRVTSSVWILNFPDRAELDAYMNEDPYFTSGLNEHVTIYRTRQVLPERLPGQLKRALDDQRKRPK